MFLNIKRVSASYQPVVIPLPRHILTSFACLLRRAVDSYSLKYVIYSYRSNKDGRYVNNFAIFSELCVFIVALHLNSRFNKIIQSND